MTVILSFDLVIVFFEKSFSIYKIEIFTVLILKL